MSNQNYRISIKPDPAKAHLIQPKVQIYEAHLLPVDKVTHLKLLADLYSPEKHNQCRQYQNRLLEGRLSAEDATEALSLINSRGQLLWESLCEQLDLRTHVPDGAKLLFDIHEHHCATTSSKYHISPCWEQLERFELYPGSYPTIRRIHTSSPNSCQEQQIRPISHYPSHDNICWINVLLMRARDLKPPATNHREEIDYCLISDILFNVRDRLSAEGSPVRINLEIVRTGSFEALEQHLDEKGIGYFSLVHFDVHGHIKPDLWWVAQFIPPIL
jgi:hypothetical protein